MLVTQKRLGYSDTGIRWVQAEGMRKTERRKRVAYKTDGMKVHWHHHERTLTASHAYCHKCPLISDAADHVNMTRVSFG